MQAIYLSSIQMNRKEFLKICGILGIGLPAQASLVGCTKDVLTSNFNGKVIIVGAGPGGMSAAYLLTQLGVDVEVLEATAQVGGRIKINPDFTDFPIPLGAEWLESDTNTLQEMVNDSSVDVDVKTVYDNPDYKFVNASWFNFFDTYIFPSIVDKIKYNEVVTSVDYTSDKIEIKTKDATYSADKVIVSVPLKILKDGDIEFT
ncbi:MAG: monoamine oxidase, partial [bacterium]